MVLRWFGNEVKGQVRSTKRKALSDGAEALLTMANQSVPLDEATLERSGSTDVDEGKGVASVFYDTKYAARLHENPQYSFQRGRRGKWLEMTLNEKGGDIRKHMADTMKRGF